jgi:hypothetical protein
VSSEAVLDFVPASEDGFQNLFIQNSAGGIRRPVFAVRSATQQCPVGRTLGAVLRVAVSGNLCR